jgi:hypothetical protein
MTQETFLEKKEENIAMHIFAVSAALVGVCFTMIGIIGVIYSFNKMNTWADEITAFDAVLFLSACFFSYVAIKTKERKPRLALEKTADTFFLSGLTVMIVICVFIVLRTSGFKLAS